MTRSKVLSALALAGLLLVGVGGAQPPQGKDAKPAPTGNKPEANIEFALEQFKPDAVADAVRNHPDIRVAEAKLRVAEAELAQAKLLVAQRVTVAEAKLQDARVRAEHAARSLQRVQQLRKSGGVAAEAMDALEKELALARAAVVAAEAELRSAQGVAPGKTQTSSGTSRTVTADGFVLVDEGSSFRLLGTVVERLTLSRTEPVSGSAAEKLRGLIDKPVKMGAQKGKLTDLLAALHTAAGVSDLTVRVPPWTAIQNTPLNLPAGERSYVAWIDLIFDEFVTTAQSPPARTSVYVREYGLMVAYSETAPPGAITLSEFARQVRAERAATKK